MIDEWKPGRKKVRVPNEEVLRNGVAHAELHLDRWDQGTWVSACGTTACLAGHILLAQGREWQDMDTFGIAYQALRALGLEGHDAMAFHFEIFNYTHDVALTGAKNVGHTPEAMKFLKQRITDVTGIEF